MFGPGRARAARLTRPAERALYGRAPLPGEQIRLPGANA
ncbi:hypothetical protein KCH_31380 [Kitasatospora cheerisanensis KCTC 2395]|uniref:Uncharacterized protein n=1 Tax=Kitasatospora cheerisanensis KCTC 2395 TaxID=1348663 RepID=A0A066YYG5_9ACTN|nr:hypothetical protein KCH_31380 [Kitasatospora cheerisanensis KCTC 2395]